MEPFATLLARLMPVAKAFIAKTTAPTAVNHMTPIIVKIKKVALNVNIWTEDMAMAPLKFAASIPQKVSDEKYL